jgi:hypothetical protein
VGLCGKSESAARAASRSFSEAAGGAQGPGAREARREAASPGPQALQRSRRKAAPGRRALCLLDAARLLEERRQLFAQGRQALERERERKAGLALGDVGEHGLAERVLVGLEVEQIVGDLERGAGVAAEGAQRQRKLHPRARRQRASLAAEGEERAGLEPAHGQGVVDGEVGAAAQRELPRLAGDELAQGPDQRLDGARHPRAHREIERRGEQPVAGQHRHAVSIGDARGGEPAAGEAVVDDVVVQQRRRVHQLRRTGQRHPAARPAPRAGGPCRQESEHRSHPLAAGTDQLRRRRAQVVGAGARGRAQDPLQPGDSLGERDAGKELRRGRARIGAACRILQIEKASASQWVHCVELLLESSKVFESTSGRRGACQRERTALW